MAGDNTPGIYPEDYYGFLTHLEKQQITLIEKTIADLSGWIKIREQPGTQFPLVGYKNHVASIAIPLPKYYTDLNACWEMERVLRPNTQKTPEGLPWEKWERYSAYIQWHMGRDDALHANANFRCRAFLWVHGRTDLLVPPCFTISSAEPTEEQLKAIIEKE